MYLPEQDRLTHLGKKYLPLLIPVSISLFFHFYLLSSRLHFLGDEAVHVQTVADMLHGTLPTVGPSASAGNGLYHGAFYYYLLFLPGLLTHFSPLGLAAFVALLSVASLVLLYRATDIVYGKKAAFCTALLYALSFNVNHFSRWTWNPNLIPFFMTLAMFSLAAVLQKRQAQYLPLLTFSLAAISQLHISGALFFPILLFMIPALAKKVPNLRAWFFSVISFIIPMLPTIYHEIRHHFPSIAGIRNSTGTPSTDTTWDHLLKGTEHIKYFYFEVIRVDPIVPLALGIGFLAFQVWSKRDKAQSSFAFFLLLTLAASLLCFGYYPEIVQVHFSEHLFPVYALLTGLMFSVFLEYPFGWIVSLLLFISITGANIRKFTDFTVNGERDYPTERQICRTISKGGVRTATVTLNGVQNPNFLSYVCKSEFDLQLIDGTSPYTVTADFATGTATVNR